MRHGTCHAYVRLGCRCEICAEGYRTYQREYSRRTRQARSKELAAAGGVRIVEGITHGYAGWANSYCRCEVCREANKRSCAEYRRRRKAAVVPS